MDSDSGFLPRKSFWPKGGRGQPRSGMKVLEGSRARFALWRARRGFRTSLIRNRTRDDFSSARCADETGHSRGLIKLTLHLLEKSGLIALASLISRSIGE